MSVDPITLVVIKGSLEQIVDEMDWTHERTAFSAVISEARDRSNGIYRAERGEVIAQGPRAHPLFTGIMQLSTQAVIDVAATSGQMHQPDDVWIVNDPYHGGTHLQDLKAVMPFFYEGKHLLFLSNQGHWVDMGGMVPGGFASSATEIFQEGVRIPPIKIYNGGELNGALLELFLANIRNPVEAEGDLKAQVNALHEGARRLEALLDRYGADTFIRSVDELQRRSEILMRKRIESIPDGEYMCEDYCDNDGVSDRPVRIALTLKVVRDTLILDFSESDASSHGPMNLTASSTMSSCYCAIRHVFPDVPTNAGSHVPIQFIVPEGSVVNCQFPSPVAGLSEMCARIVDVVLGALSKAIPEAVPANHFGTANNLSLGATDADGRRHVAYLYHGGGYGGSSESDGLIHGSTTVGMARMMPVEVVEQRYPILYTRFAIRDGSGGAGYHPGGCGCIYEFRFIGREAYASVCGDRAVNGPKGIAGGHEGAKNRVSFVIDGHERVPPLLSKIENVRLQRGDIITLETPGGGGYGDPAKRDPQLVLRDVRRRYLDAEQALRDYGCVVEWDGQEFHLDEAGTNEIRKTRKRGVQRSS